MPWKPRYPDEVPSLGWQVLEFASAYLPSPSDEEEPFVFTDEQALDIVAWYSLDPATGRHLYRRGAQEEPKGWGKSPWAAVLGIVELAGPVVFDGWDANGQPVGRPWGTKGTPPPLIQVAAVSEDQTENTYGALYDLLTARGGEPAQELRIDIGLTRCMLMDRPGRIDPVTAAAGSREGQRLTFGILDETHLWFIRNGGVRLARTMRRNAAKMGGRTMETTNAPMLGEGSVAEQTIADAAEGKPGILHLARRPSALPQPDWPDERKLAALGEVYRGATWIDRHRILADAADMPWADALRFFFNTPTAGNLAAMDPKLWKAREAHRDPPPAGTRIGLGFDGSVSRDSTFLRACTADGWSWLIKHWTKPVGAPHDWRVPRSDVETVIAQTFETYDVGRMYVDPPFWRTEAEDWAERWGTEVVLFLDTNQPSRFAPEVDRWTTGTEEGRHTHDGDPVTTDHVLAAHLRKVHLRQPDDDGRTRYVIVKGSSGDRIDGAVADILAYAAAMTMPEAEPEPVYFYPTR